MAGYRTLHLDDIPTVRFEDDSSIPSWKPVRRHLGVEAFGTNAYVGEQPGDIVIDASRRAARRRRSAHQELYLVVGGRARFTVGDDSFDVPSGGIVFLDDPALVREAVAVEPATVIFAVGSPVEAPFSPPTGRTASWLAGPDEPEDRPPRGALGVSAPRNSSTSGASRPPVERPSPCYTRVRRTFITGNGHKARKPAG